MSGGALVFLLVSWSLVLGLTLWSFRRVLRHQRHRDPDGIGPASPPEAALTERDAGSRSSAPVGKDPS